MITVFIPAGTVTAVARGTIEAVEVAGAVEEEPPMTVTKTVTV